MPYGRDSSDMREDAAAPGDSARPRQEAVAWLALSFALFALAYIIDQMFRWSDPFSGFMNGVIHAWVMGILWCLFLLPWGLLVLGLYRWRKWRRYAAFWILAPSLSMFVWTAGSLVFEPPTASTRFERFVEAKFPENAEELHVFFSGGGLADYGDAYFFKTTPEEVDRLIREMDLSLQSHSEPEGFPVVEIAECPSFSLWAGPQHYKGGSHESGWFYDLVVDASRTQVYLRVGCI